jgi:hypothetical protein
MSAQNRVQTGIVHNPSLTPISGNSAPTSAEYAAQVIQRIAAVGVAAPEPTCRLQAVQGVVSRQLAQQKSAEIAIFRRFLTTSRSLNYGLLSKMLYSFIELISHTGVLYLHHPK